MLTRLAGTTRRSAKRRAKEFDHVRGEKLYNISDLTSQNFRRENIEAEIEKCEVRCANCHRIKTFNQFSWRTFD